MWNSGSGFLKHPNWSIWWKNTGQRAEYACRNFEAEQESRLFYFLTQKSHLVMILDPPKRYWPFRTCEILVWNSFFWVVYTLQDPQYFVGPFLNLLMTERVKRDDYMELEALFAFNDVGFKAAAVATSDNKYFNCKASDQTDKGLQYVQGIVPCIPCLLKTYHARWSKGIRYC